MAARGESLRRESTIVTGWSAAWRVFGGVGHARLAAMRTDAGDTELTMDELRAVAGYAVACAEPALVIFDKERPDDPGPAAALHAGRLFAEGAPRSRIQRAAATDAHRAARDTTTEAASHAATAAGDAAAAAYLHPLAKASQVRHILGAAAHAARAAELARGDDPVVAEYVITAAAKRATPVLLAYYVNGSAFLAFSSIAERHQVTIDDGRSLSFIGGLAEGTETIAVHSLWCILPMFAGTIAWVWAGVVFLSAAYRVVAGYRRLRPPDD